MRSSAISRMSPSAGLRSTCARISGTTALVPLVGGAGMWAAGGTGGGGTTRGEPGNRELKPLPRAFLFSIIVVMISCSTQRAKRAEPSKAYYSLRSELTKLILILIDVKPTTYSSTCIYVLCWLLHCDRSFRRIVVPD